MLFIKLTTYVRSMNYQQNKEWNIKQMSVKESLYKKL